MDNIWQQRSNTFWPGTDALTTKVIPPAIYRYVATLTGWYLEMVAPRFEFPYKIYGNHDHITARVRTAWDTLEGNLGILLNGIKGTGKTVSAQLLGNWAIDHGILVLAVHGPVPLTDILEHVEQPVLVIFDEFEKTHDKKEEQQALLTALDGMARSKHKRMFVFTTNTKAVDENFVDRPSRIRYCWEFRRLTDDVVESLLDDLLSPKMSHFRTDILSYLSSRKILSIDVAKTVINEVNTFGEAPSVFADVLNLTEQDAGGFILEVLDDKRQPTRTLANYFSLRRGDNIRLRALLTKTGRDAFITDIARYHESYTFEDPIKNLAIQVVEATEHMGEWLCHVRIPPVDTWIGKFHKASHVAYNDTLWLDERPADWKIPDWARRIRVGPPSPRRMRKQGPSGRRPRRSLAARKSSLCWCVSPRTTKL